MPSLNRRPQPSRVFRYTGTGAQPKTMAEGRAHFFSCVKHVLETGEREYVKDKSGVPFLTIDREKRHSGAEIEVGAQFVKDHFGPVCALVKFGIVLKVGVPKSSDGAVYLRRHTRFRHPCDPLIERWQHALAETRVGGAAAEAERRLIDLLRANDRRQDGRHEEAYELLKALKLGIARLAIGHQPFTEGLVADANS